MDSNFKRLVCVLFLMVGLLMIGCEQGVLDANGDGNGNDNDETALARFIHSAASAGKLDYTYLDQDDDTFYAIVMDMEYGEQNGYYSWFTGPRSFQVYIGGTNLAAANVTTDLVDEGVYSIIAADLDAAINPELLVLADTLIFAPTGSAYLRFLHASADAPDLDIMSPDSTILFANLSQYDVTPYVEVPEGTYTYTSVASVDSTAMPAMGTITLLSGMNYTAILSGTVNGLPGPGFNVALYPETSIEDALAKGVH